VFIMRYIKLLAELSLLLVHGNRCCPAALPQLSLLLLRGAGLEVAIYGYATRRRKVLLAHQLLTQLLLPPPEWLAPNSARHRHAVWCGRRVCALFQAADSAAVVAPRRPGLHVGWLGHRVGRRVYERDARQQRRRRADRQDEQLRELKERIVKPISTARPSPGSASA